MELFVGCTFRPLLGVKQGTKFVQTPLILAHLRFHVFYIWYKYLLNFAQIFVKWYHRKDLVP